MAILISLGVTTVVAQQPDLTESPVAAEEAAKIPDDQLDSLVAPIALYPDPLLAQTLAASTYPLEIIQLQQWMDRNKNLKDQALEDALLKQNWDPSIQAMAAVPEAVQRMAGNIQWTTELGNAFLAQPSDVMDAVQRMRAKAQGNGALKTTAQQKIETQTVEGGKQVIVVQQANPKIVYVPKYDPVVVYGQPAYPYYPYNYPGYVTGAALAFGTGVALGAAWGGNWGWGCGWGRGSVTYNYTNKYVYNGNRNNNINTGNVNRPSQLPTNGGNWQHNPKHRGAAPYDRRSADKFGGRTPSQLPAGGGNRLGGGAGLGNRPGGGAATLPAGGAGIGKRPGGGGAGIANRPSGGVGARGNRPSGGSGLARPGGGGGASTMPANHVGNNSIGNRNLSSNRGGGNALGGGGLSGNSARAASSRGNSSLGGGGRGGGAKAGGGGRRR